MKIVDAVLQGDGTVLLVAENKQMVIVCADEERWQFSVNAHLAGWVAEGRKDYTGGTGSWPFERPAGGKPVPQP